jgi:hypothetical protein
MPSTKNSRHKNYYGPLRSQFTHFRIWARKNKKFPTLRTSYSILRLLFVSFPIWLRNDHKLMIIGCGRSATHFASHLFHELGIHIGHERLEKHGIVSWTLVPDTYTTVWGPSYNQIRHLYIPIVHQVRNPLDVISSVGTVFSDRKSWNFISKFIPINVNDSLILRGMKYWYFWNLLAEKKAVYTYRVENIENELEKLLVIGRFETTVDNEHMLEAMSNRISVRKHPNLTWNDLKEADKALTNMIITMSKRYGYNV